MHDQWLGRAIQQFHASADAEEIKRQLAGIRPSDYLAPLAVQYQLPERARIAKLFSEAVEISDREKLYQLRIDLVKELALICHRREKARPRQGRAGSKPAKPSKPISLKRSPRLVIARSSSIDSTEPLKAANKAATATKIQLSCPFCTGKYDEAYIVKHISEKHGKQSMPFHYPYDTCSGIVRGAMYFTDYHKYRHEAV